MYCHVKSNKDKLSCATIIQSISNFQYIWSFTVLEEMSKSNALIISVRWDFCDEKYIWI